MKTILGVLAIMSVAFGVYFYFDNRYALSQEVKKIEQRLDYKIVQDQVQSKDDRIYKIQERYPDKSKMPQTVKEENDKLQKEKAVLEKRLEVMEKK